jgi:hypothetical protein
MILRYICLILLTGAAGALSALFWLIPNGLMAAALAMSLSAGTIHLAIKQRAQNGKLAVKDALITGLGSGLLGGVLMAVISQVYAGLNRHEFGPPLLPFWAPLVMGVLYGVSIHWNYYQRRFLPHPLGQTVIRTCGLCFLFKAALTFLYLAIVEPVRGELWGMLFGSCVMSLLGAVPFAFLWVTITAALDPEWSQSDWQSASSYQN